MGGFFCIIRSLEPSTGRHPMPTVNIRCFGGHGKPCPYGNVLLDENDKTALCLLLTPFKYMPLL